MKLRVFIYKFEFFSGFFESCFYKQVKAKDEPDAIIQIVSFFTDKEENETKEQFEKVLGKNWKVNDFWEKYDLRFQNKDETVGYNLIWINEVNFDLDFPQQLI